MKEYMESVDIMMIRPGDIVLHNNVLKTVCRTNISFSRGIGRLLFGDSYQLGYKKVKRITNVGLFYLKKGRI